MRRFVRVVTSLTVVGVSLLGSPRPQSLHAQSGLRESLERLDRNKDGVISPDEITPLARPYLERLSRSDYRSRISLDQPNEITKLQELARRYYAVQNGASGRQDVRPQGESNVLPFGRKPDEPLVPGFGLAEVKYPYTQDDLDFADRTLGDYDRNKDGYIDRAEAAAARKWTHRNPFDDDLNQDDRLSRMEMAQRYARRRLLDGASTELRRKAWRTGGEIRPSAEALRRQEEQALWKRGGGTTYLTASVLGRFDANRNGSLEEAEVENLGLPASQIDTDGDGSLSRGELLRFMIAIQEEAGDEVEELPAWFHELDANRDGQVEMAEFASEWTPEKLEAFAAYDTNGDALLTSAEVVQAQSNAGIYSNQSAEVLAPRKSIISEIEVSEDYLIGDLNVQISITHSNDSHLDAYLTGPDGQRIELFTEVGGSGNNFEKTYFDDQSVIPVTKGRAPFRGTFIPEGKLKNEPSLSHFNGKSIAGVWQLVVRGTRNDRFGMLHGWSLIAKPEGSGLVGTPAPVSTPATSTPEPTTYRSSNSRLLIRNPANSVGEKTQEVELNWTSDERRQAVEKYKAWIENQNFEKGELPPKAKLFFKVNPKDGQPAKAAKPSVPG